MENTVGFAVVILLGLFPIFCSVKNFNWFFEHRKARFLVNLIGRKGARIFYALLGVVIAFCGIMGLIGMHSGGIF